MSTTILTGANTELERIIYDDLTLNILEKAISAIRVEYEKARLAKKLVRLEIWVQRDKPNSNVFAYAKPAMMQRQNSD